MQPKWDGFRLAKAARYLDHAARASLTRVGLTKEEFKVLCALHTGVRSHGSLCRALRVSTGAMTNRLDKLERAGLLARSRDPDDRRGVLLELTPLGHTKLDQYIDTAAIESANSWQRSARPTGNNSTVSSRRCSPHCKLNSASSDDGSRSIVGPTPSTARTTAAEPAVSP